MNEHARHLLFSTALGLCAVGAAAAQDPTPRPSEAPPAEAPPAEAGAEAWIEQLGADSYKQRLEAERRLRELGQAAVPALERAAASHADGEVQWRARRLLRQIERGFGPGLRDRRVGDAQDPVPQDPVPQDSVPQDPVPQGRPGRALPRDAEAMRRQFDRLFERFERDFGMDVPRVRFFEDDFFRDLEAQMDALRGDARAQGMTVQIGPDGVRVEVQERQEDGSFENKVYEAPDLETFQEQYPDVLRDNGLGLGLQPFGGRLPGQLRGFVNPLQRGFDPGDVTPRVVPSHPALPGVDAFAVPPPDDRRLGVLVRELPPALREYLELGEGVGLMVQSVQEGTLAAALGLAADDIVVRIGDRPIGGPADVQAALGAIDAGGEVVVEFVRKGQRRTAKAAKPAVEAAGRGKLQPRKQDGGGSIR